MEFTQERITEVNVSGFAKSNKRLAGIIALMVLVVMLFSASYITSHIHHECKGGDCPICACMHQCAGILKSLGNGTTCNRAVGICLLTALMIISLQAVCNKISTPVSDKVRMND